MGCLVAAACAPRPNGQSAQPETAAAAPAVAPVITSIEPDTISLGQGAVPTLVIQGRGFVPGGTSGGFADGNNTVRVGRAAFDRIASDPAGTTLRFQLPLTYSDSSARGRESSFGPGEYPVSVVTANGTSNSLTLTMIR